MKKFIALTLALLLVIGTFGACASSQPAATTAPAAPAPAAPAEEAPVAEEISIPDAE